MATTLTRAEYDAVLLAASWLIGFAPIFAGRKWTWLQCVGLALLASPFVRFGLDIYLTIDALFVFEVLQPVSREALWSGIQTRLVEDLVVPLVGLLLMTNAVPGLASTRAPRGRVPDALRAHGLAPWHSWRVDALRGLALFFLVAAAYLAAWWLSRTFLLALSAGGDESQYWRNITIPLIVLVSGTAGLTEEFLFRGVLLTALQKRMRFWAAALVQGFFFALIHSGYGTWTHVVGPLAFGLGMAWVARVLGVLPAALLHAEVNVMFFALDVAPTYIAAQGAWGAAKLAALVAAWGFAGAAALWATRADAVKLLWGSLRRRTPG